MNVFAPDWEKWLDLNIGLNNCKTSMFKQSLEAGYDYALIKGKLGIDYTVDSKNSTITKTVALRTAAKLNARSLDIYKIPNFLTAEECDAVIDIIKSSDLTPSTIYDNNQPNKSSVRTSNTCYFKRDNNIITDIDTRICKTIGLNNRFAEQIQGQVYTVGQEFKRHQDSFPSDAIEHYSGQRTWTFMVYLNDVEEGGHTSFPYAYTSCKAERGTAVIWNNLTDNKTGNKFSTHCGMPVLKGEKYILTKWFRDRETSLDVKNQICDNHFLPVLHPIGFEKVTMKLDCIDAIKSWMTANEANFKAEVFDDGKEERGKVFSNILSLDNAPSELKDNVKNTFKELLTKWIDYKSELTHCATYGIREYLTGSELYNHYDRPTTHIISAIIHIDSDMPWELYVEDHTFRPHRITMNYGDIVFYESTTCMHGRPTPFEGKSYRNMYVHFKPELW